MTNQGGNEPHEFHYLVDGEDQATPAHVLTVEKILVHANLTPAGDYYLVEYIGKSEVKHETLSDEIRIHEGQRFTAVKRGGPTPVS